MLLGYKGTAQMDSLLSIVAYHLDDIARFVTLISQRELKSVGNVKAVLQRI